MSVVIGIYYDTDKSHNEIAIYNSELDTVESRIVNQSTKQVISDLKTEFGKNLMKICLMSSKCKRRILKFFPKVHLMSKEESCFNCYSSAKLNVGDKIFECTIDEGLIKYFLYIISSSHFKIKFVKAIKIYESYSNEESLKEIAANVFNLKQGEANFVFRVAPGFNQTGNEFFLQKIQKDEDYFASITTNEIMNADHYKAMIFGRFLMEDKKVQSLMKTEPNYFFENAFDKGVNKLSDKRFLHKSRVIVRPRSINTYKSQTSLMGIDLGATRCVVSVSRNQTTDLVKIDQDYSMPTFISFFEEKPIIGSVALRHLKRHPKSVLFDIKRTTDLSAQNFEKCWPFGICRTSESMSFIVHSEKQMKEYSLVDVYQILLQKLKSEASKFQSDLNKGNYVNQAVITVPFLDQGPAGHGMISSIIKAANQCGIRIIDVIEETHADFIYCLTQYEITPNQSVFLIDIGGSTAIVREYNYIEDINGKKIIDQFNIPLKDHSGRKMDEILTLKLQELLSEKYNLQINQSEQYEMLTKVEKIKCDLSTSNEAYLEWPKIKEPIEITRQWFEENVLKPILPFKTSGDFLDKPISKVFLIGGGFRIPYFQKYFATFFGEQKIVIPGELQHITATGALIHGLQILDGEIEPFFDLKKLKEQKLKYIENETKPDNDSMINQTSSTANEATVAEFEKLNTHESCITKPLLSHK